jgi:hypothetical protein
MILIWHYSQSIASWQTQQQIDLQFSTTPNGNLMVGFKALDDKSDKVVPNSLFALNLIFH